MWAAAGNSCMGIQMRETGREKSMIYLRIVRRFKSEPHLSFLSDLVLILFIARYIGKKIKDSI